MAYQPLGKVRPSHVAPQAGWQQLCSYVRSALPMSTSYGKVTHAGKPSADGRRGKRGHH